MATLWCNETVLKAHLILAYGANGGLLLTHHRSSFAVFAGFLLIVVGARHTQDDRGRAS